MRPCARAPALGKVIEHVVTESTTLPTRHCLRARQRQIARAIWLTMSGTPDAFAVSWPPGEDGAECSHGAVQMLRDEAKSSATSMLGGR